MWSLGWYPYNDPVSRHQEAVERMYEREDEALKREAVHEYDTKGSEDEDFRRGTELGSLGQTEIGPSDSKQLQPDNHAG